MMTQMTSLHEVRLDHVFQRIKNTGARRVLDLGCGSGSLLYRLLQDDQFTEIVGLEASGQSLLQARTMLRDYLNERLLDERLLDESLSKSLVTNVEENCDENRPSGTPRLRLVRGSYAEPHPALIGYDAAAMVETIEHVRPETLSAVELAVFGQLRPGVVYMTTPNREYNPLLGLAPGEFREEDHKFEWDQAKFRRWCMGVARRNGYRAVIGGIGEYRNEFGYPTQTAFFERLD